MDFDLKFDHREPEGSFSLQQVELALDAINDVPKVLRAEPLAGGYSHINYRLDTVDGTFVMRVSNKGEREFDAEIAILDRLAESIPLPRVIWSKKNVKSVNRHIAILNFVNGDLLSKVEDGLEEAEIRTIASQLGRILAKIHSVTFEKSGFFDGSLTITEAFPSFTVGYIDYMQSLPHSQRVATRLTPSTLSKLKTYMIENSAISKMLKLTSQLTHSDFNQKNIMVNKVKGEWKVTAILDWEFAYSGCPLGDFGNFFRYPEMNPHYKQPFVEAYRKSGGHLPGNWEEKARYLDILPMLQFLDKDEDLPNTFETARSVINHTLSLYMD